MLLPRSTRTRRRAPSGSGCTTRPAATWPSLVTDTAGRAWRTGQTDLAVGVAGLEPLDDFAGPHRHLRQRARGHRARRRRRARLARRAGHRQARRPTRLRRARAGRPGAPARRARPRAPCVLVRPREQDMFALGAREAVLAAVRGDQADCFGAPASAEEVRRGARVVRPGRPPVEAISVRVELPHERTRPGGRGRAGAAGRPRPRLAPAERHRRGTPSRSHRPLRRLRSARTARPREADEWPRRTRARTERRAIAEQMRQEQARKERLRSLADPRRLRRSSSSACSAAALLPYVKDRRDEKAGSRHADRASSASRRRPPAATPVKTVDANRLGPAHQPAGTKIPYHDAPPAFGPHWPQLPAGLGDPHLLHRRATGPSSSGSCTASSTATRSSGTTTP